MRHRRLEAQEKAGWPYLVGDSVSAADIYWATKSMSFLVPPPEIMPVTRQIQGMLKYFSMNARIPAIAEVLTEAIEAHQSDSDWLQAARRTIESPVEGTVTWGTPWPLLHRV